MCPGHAFERDSIKRIRRIKIVLSQSAFSFNHIGTSTHGIVD
jgi:hypothetical protein